MEDETLEAISNISAPSGTPEEIAKMLFSNKPDDPCSRCIIPYSEGAEEIQTVDKVSFNFEILLTIYLEGLMNIMDVIKQNNELVADMDIYNNLSMSDLKFPDPWFKSFGYSISVTEYGADRRREFNNKIKPFSYCRIILSFDPKDRTVFIMKNITKKYHFLLSSNYRPTNVMEDMYAVLTKNDVSYVIKFFNYRK